MERFVKVADQYQDFAAYAVESPSLRRWALAVCDDLEVLAWVAALPRAKQQPNLVFAAARWHGVDPDQPYAALRDALLHDDGQLRATIMSRSTQTNEVGRLATLLPAFAQLAEAGRPLALVEVGASAGLCLYPDRYDYDWGTPGALRGSGGPLLTCDAAGGVPVPAEHPRVAWRSGIDLNPLDVADQDATDWLTTLVWPEQHERRSRLRSAIELSRDDPPRLVRGDMLDLLPAEVEAAAERGTVVVFHSAVVAYLGPTGRDRFHDLMSTLVHDGACHWVSNEGPQVLPRVTASGPPVPTRRPTFVLGIDGHAVAWTHQHGAGMEWLQPRQ